MVNPDVINPAGIQHHQPPIESTEAEVLRKLAAQTAYYTEAVANANKSWQDLCETRRRQDAAERHYAVQVRRMHQTADDLAGVREALLALPETP